MSELKALMLAMEDFLNEPPRSYDIEPMEVRDYRHQAHRVWEPLCRALLANQSPIREAVEGEERIARTICRGLAYGPDSMFGPGNRPRTTPMWTAYSELARKVICEQGWKCAARGSVGANDPQDCDWPVCGCDPYAAKVIAALEESGLAAIRTPSSAG